jgi:hypothetical protein
LRIPSSSRSPDHDPHRTIYYLGYPLGRFAALKHRQGPSPTRRPCPAAFPRGPTRQDASSFYLRRPAQPRRLLAQSLAAAPPPAAFHLNPSAQPPLLHSAAVAQPSRSPSGGSQGGEEEDHVVCLRPRALHRRVGLAGAPPPRFSAVRRPAPSSPLLEVAVVFAVHC